MTKVTATVPIRMKAKDGADGDKGDAGRLVYPAGEYSADTSYTTTSRTAPYVYDPLDGNYYILDSEMTWTGTEHDSVSPSQDTSGVWLKFEQFSAIFAKIGVIANGLIGSAVFNGDWMFSQYGVYGDDENFGASAATITTYSAAIEAGRFDTSKFFTGSYWHPAMALNLRLGSFYLNYGKTYFTDWNSEIDHLKSSLIETDEMKAGMVYQDNVDSSTDFPTIDFDQSYPNCIFTKFFTASTEEVGTVLTKAGTGHDTYIFYIRRRYTYTTYMGFPATGYYVEKKTWSKNSTDVTLNVQDFLPTLGTVTDTPSGKTATEYICKADFELMNVTTMIATPTGGSPYKLHTCTWFVNVDAYPVFEEE